ncbi:MAG: AAA family ATPase [Deltaproteobacteria bacterium]|nr:MAG: AAA family ATPase [Deltaproteobacteria bacterium]
MTLATSRAPAGSVPDASRLSLLLFPLDGADAIARLIGAIKARKDRMIERWCGLAASRLGQHRALSERLFRQTYIPRLRTAIESLARGDRTSFLTFAADFGAQVATAGLPFAVVVAHVNLLKESCVGVLADDTLELSTAILLLDKLTACFVSVAAEGYYVPARRNGNRGDAGALPFDTAGATSPRIFHGMVGGSDAMQRVFAQIRRVAAGAASVLVVGETGTGKELVARAVHTVGPRRDGPFIALNCAALPRELIESELFGHKRGAFSGAVSESLGLFRAAAGGTLLLDEITEMVPELQAKLLRVLQEKAVRPVGSALEEPVDVRIIASSNRDPEAAVRSRLLRADLYYRLSVSKIMLPPLRERREDIPALVEYHVGRLNGGHRDADPRARGVSPEAMQLLFAQPWLGNVRQLFNVVEDAFTTGEGRVGLTELALPSTEAEVAPVAPAGALLTFQETERTLIERALVLTGGNKVRAARQLGISRKKLYAKLALYRLRGIVAAGAPR